jgi:hypothetical protein
MGEHQGPCEPCPVCDAKDRDFASLLEREPLDERLEHPTLPVPKAALDSAVVRIKSLEDVLVAIRVKLIDGLIGGDLRRSATDAERMIAETLDPCKPWCTRQEPGHPGACEPRELERD